MPDWNNKNHFRLYSGRSTYHAVLGTPPIHNFSSDNKKLYVEGFKIGTVDGLGASYYEKHTSTEKNDFLVQTTSSSNAYNSDDGLREAIWRTLIGNRVPQIPKKVAPRDQSALLQCPLKLDGSAARISRGRKAFEHLLAQNAKLRIAGRSLSEFFPACAKKDPDNVQNSLEQIFRFHRSRRLVVTLSGHFGLVPIAARKNDLVFILLGCNVPMVLREVETGEYQLIGGCYLHGFMEGEAMGDLHSGTVTLERVCLQ